MARGEDERGESHRCSTSCIVKQEKEEEERKDLKNVSNLDY